MVFTIVVKILSSSFIVVSNQVAYDTQLSRWVEFEPNRSFLFEQAIDREGEVAHRRRSLFHRGSRVCS